MAIVQRMSYIAVQSAGQCDQIFAALSRQPLASDQWHTTHLPFEKRPGQQLRQLAVPRCVLAQQDQPQRPRSIVFVGNAKVHTDDRFDACRHRLLVEFNHAEQVVLVGQRHGGHAIFSASSH